MFELIKPHVSGGGHMFTQLPSMCMTERITGLSVVNNEVLKITYLLETTASMKYCISTLCC